MKIWKFQRKRKKKSNGIKKRKRKRKHENMKIPKTRKHENTKTRKHENTVNTKTRKHENTKTQKIIEVQLSLPTGGYIKRGFDGQNWKVSFLVQYRLDDRSQATIGSGAVASWVRFSAAIEWPILFNRVTFNDFWYLNRNSRNSE